MTTAGMNLWTSDEAANATAGRTERTWTATGVSIDSRSIAPGDLFVALAGPNHDGHDFVLAALERGAAAAMVHRDVSGLPSGAPLLRVADTFSGLHGLGKAARSRLRGQVIAVTGSVGKTGVKEALQAVLADQGRVAANRGNLNNHWGVPLSLARLPRDTDFAVLEIGMNHAGEITPLSRLVRPHVAVITTVAAVHIGNFASVEAIADAKAEIFAGVVPGGAAVLNFDNEHIRRLEAAAAAAGIDRIFGFGREAPASGAQLIEAASDAEGSTVSAEIGGQAQTYRVGAPGPHWIINSLCVLAVTFVLGADVPSAAAALTDLTVSKGRGQRHAISVGGGSLTLIDDSYNASPTSMAAAFATAATMPTVNGGRRIAALGDMLELGEAEVWEHTRLADLLLDAGFDLVFTAGPLMAELHAALPDERRGQHAATSAELAALLPAMMQAGDVVVVKGSAGSRMGLVVDALTALNDDRRPVANGD